MAYNKTNWQNLPNESTPVSANNLNKIENELETLDNRSSALLNLGAYTSVEGTYTTAAWSAGTATNCTWTAPRSGLYILWARFLLEDETKAWRYKKLQLRGTATKLINQELVWEAEGTSTNLSAIISFQGSTLISATQGQTIVPYIHTPEAGVVWDIKIVGLFLK